MKEIPTSLRVGGSTINVVLEENGDAQVGTCSLFESTITIYRTFLSNNKTYNQSVESMVNTFYHELTHAILDTMGETELSSNEKFVNAFAGFLTEAVRSFKFNEETK